MQIRCLRSTDSSLYVKLIDHLALMKDYGHVVSFVFSHSLMRRNCYCLSHYSLRSKIC
jgi:hypothetical protein